MLREIYWTAHAGSGRRLPGAPFLVPAPVLAGNPSLQRSCPMADGVVAFVVGDCDCGAGTVPPLWTGGFGRLRSSPEATEVPAFAPALTPTVPELEIDLTCVPEIVAVPQAAVRSAAATRSTRNLFIATGITQRATLTDGLHAA